MRRYGLLLGMVAVAGTSFACGGGDADTVATTAASAATPTPVPTSVPAARLEEMLLTLDDVGAGWQPGPPVNEADLHDSVQVPCDPVLDPALVARLQATTGVQFEPVGGTPGLLIEFLTTGEPEQLAADVQAYQDAFAACPPTSTAADGSGYELGTFTLPELGDQRLGFHVDGVEQAGSEVVWHSTGAQVRTGGVFLTLGLIEIVPVGGTPVIGDDEFGEILTAAVGRVTACPVTPDACA